MEHFPSHSPLSQIAFLDSLKHEKTSAKYINKVRRHGQDKSTSLWHHLHGKPCDLSPPPRNSSNETRIELDIVIQRQADATHEEIEFSRRMDDILEVYQWFDREAFRLTGKGYGYGWLRDIAERGDALTNYMKLKFGRPRPYDIAPYMNRTLSSLVGDIDTASYPSGHAADSYLIAKVLSRFHSEHAEEFDSMARRIAESRMILGVHFPSDLVAGEIVATYSLQTLGF